MTTDYGMLMRDVQLTIALLGGIFSIFLGWKLYVKGIDSAVHSDLSAENKFRLKISSVGPGVFFALFGMYIVVAVVNMPAEDTEETQVESPATTRNEVLRGMTPSALAATVPATPPTCLVRRRTRKHYDGAQLSVADVNEALDTSISLLRQTPGPDQLLSARRLNTLNEMRASTGEWRLP